MPTSVENDVAATQLSFGFNSALSFTVDMLERVRQAAQAAQKIGVVEVLGEHAGWLALQAGIAVCADAVLIPEISYDLEKVAAKLRTKIGAGQGEKGDVEQLLSLADTLVAMSNCGLGQTAAVSPVDRRPGGE